MKILEMKFNRAFAGFLREDIDFLTLCFVVLVCFVTGLPLGKRDNIP